MRAYQFLDGDPSKLAGWRFTTDRKDGNGCCLWPANMRPGDAYPDHFLLATPVGDCWQLCALSNDEGRRAELEAALTSAASKAGLALYDSAKAFAAAKPTLAASHLCEQEAVSGPDVAVLDKDGKPVLDEKGVPTVTPTWTTRPKPGAPLQLKACLAGDDAAASADPKLARDTLLEEIET